MNETDGNPKTNHLQAGVTDDQLEAAVRKSGYPLQRVVAEALLSDFTVTEEWGYIDRESKEHRALDVFGSRDVAESEHLWLRVALLVECKRSDLPYVFFGAAAPQAPREFPTVAGLRGKEPQVHVPGVGSRSSSIAELLCLRDFSFVSPGPLICSSFARAERKSKELDLSGTVPFRQVVLPLISALQHYTNLQKTVGSQEKVPACLLLPLCVIDGPMVSVQGTPEAPRLELRPWIRVVRQEAVQETHWIAMRHYVVDFVHRGYLADFVRDDLFPFVDQFAERSTAMDEVLFTGAAQVPSFDEWTFQDLRPFK